MTSEQAPSKDQLSEQQIRNLLADAQFGIKGGRALDSLLVSAWALEQLCEAALAQRAAHEPPADAHPEAFCELCGRENACWFAPSEVWNVACGDRNIICPVCFIKLTEAAGIKPTSWLIAPEGYSAQPPAPDAVAMAVRFHEAYERLAPLYGYETRTDTRAFDPDSKNGRLMTAVCMELFGLPMPRLPQMVAQQAERIRDGLDERYSTSTKESGQ